MRKTSLVRIYEEDKEFLKKMKVKSIAEAITSLIWGKKEQLEALVKTYMESEVMPYVKDKIEEIKSSI